MPREDGPTMVVDSNRLFIGWADAGYFLGHVPVGCSDNPNSSDNPNLTFPYAPHTHMNSSCCGALLYTYMHSFQSP